MEYCRLVTGAQIIDIASRQVMSLVSPKFRAAYARPMVLCVLMRETQEVASPPLLSLTWRMNEWVSAMGCLGRDGAAPRGSCETPTFVAGLTDKGVGVCDGVY
jgi:hypothetical protein